jgi:hypothetical protein
MRGLFAGAIAALAGLAGGASGFMLHASMPVPVVPPTVLLATPDAASRPELLNQCRSMDDVAAVTLPGQVQIFEFETIWQKKFAPVTAILLRYSNTDGELVLGYVFTDGCVGPPIVLSRSPLNHITGRP